MPQPIQTQLGTFTATGSGTPRVGQAGDHTFSASLAGSGSISATVLIEVSNDLLGWATLTTLTLSGTGSASAQSSQTASHAYWRATVSSITAGASLTVVAATEEAAGGGGGQFSSAEVATIRGVVSGDGMLTARDSLGWSLADASIHAYRAFGQFADGSYLITNGVGAEGNSSTRLCVAVGDPRTGWTSVTPITASGGTVGDKLDATGAQIVDGDAACQIDQAWIDADGDIWYVQRGNPTVTNTRRYLRRLKFVSGAWADGTDASATNKRAVLNIGSPSNGAYATQTQEIRPLHSLSWCEYVIGSGGALTRAWLFAEYNVAAGRVTGSTNDQVICWRMTKTGGAVNAATKLLEFNTSGSHLFDHFHGVQQDPYTRTLYFTCGDTGDECALIRWDGRSAAPAANSTWAQVAATPGWGVSYGDEMRRYGGLIFLPDAIVGLPDGDVEATVGDSTAAQSVVIDRGLAWVMPTGQALTRTDDIPPLIPLRTRSGALIYGCLRTQTANTTAQQYMDFWTSHGGRAWKRSARVVGLLAQTANIRELWEDSAGNVFASCHRNNQRFTGSADSCVIFRPALVNADRVAEVIVSA